MGRDNKEREEFVKRRDGIFLKEKTITKFIYRNIITSFFYKKWRGFEEGWPIFKNGGDRKKRKDKNP